MVRPQSLVVPGPTEGAVPWTRPSALGLPESDHLGGLPEVPVIGLLQPLARRPRDQGPPNPEGAKTNLSWTPVPKAVRSRSVVLLGGGKVKLPVAISEQAEALGLLGNIC